MTKLKQKLKYYLPPIVLDKLINLKVYKDFLKYKKLVSKNNELKNIHKGKRCFILGSGTSIEDEDLKPLKNEIVFALNNFYVHKDFAEIISGDMPKYYMTAPIHPPQTEQEWKKWFYDMEQNIPFNTNMLFGLNGNHVNIKYIFDKYQLFTNHKINWYYSGIRFNKNAFSENFMDITKPIYGCQTVSLYALMMAIYMGFKEIYLLGMDHNYLLYDREADMRMYDNAIHQHDELKRTFGDDFYTEEFLRQYDIFIKYKSFSKINKDFLVFNTSSISLLRVFPKIKLKEVLK